MLFKAPVCQADICSPETSEDLAARLQAKEFHPAAKILQFIVEVYRQTNPVFVRTSYLAAYSQSDLSSGPHMWPHGQVGRSDALDKWNDDAQFHHGMLSLPVDWFAESTRNSVRVSIFWTPTLALISRSTSSGGIGHGDRFFDEDAPDDLRAVAGLFVVPRGRDHHAQLQAWPKARATWPLFETLWKTRGLDGQDYPNLAQPIWPSPAKVLCNVADPV